MDIATVCWSNTVLHFCLNFLVSKAGVVAIPTAGVSQKGAERN